MTRRATPTSLGVTVVSREIAHLKPKTAQVKIRSGQAFILQPKKKATKRLLYSGQKGKTLCCTLLKTNTQVFLNFLLYADSYGARNTSVEMCSHEFMHFLFHLKSRQRLIVLLIVRKVRMKHKTMFIDRYSYGM